MNRHFFSSLLLLILPVLALAFPALACHRTPSPPQIRFRCHYFGKEMFHKLGGKTNIGLIQV